MVMGAPVGNLDTVDNLSQREYILIGVQPQFGIEAPFFVTTPVIPGTGSYQAGKLQLLDTGRRGVNASDFGAQEGVGEGTITIESEMRIPDEDEDQMMVLGYLIANLLETGSKDESDYTFIRDNVTDNDSNQGGAQADALAIHNLTAGTRKTYLTVKHGVTDVFEHTYLDCKATNLAFSFQVGEGFATFSVTLMGQDRQVEDEPRGVAEVFTSSGLLVAGWHCLGVIPGGRTEGTATLKASSIANLDDDFSSQIQSMDWSLDREAQRFYGADQTQDMNDIFLGPLTATVALSVIFRASEDIELYTKKVQGLVASELIPQYKGKQLPNETPNRAIRIGSRLTDFADELLAVNMGDIHAAMPFAARAIYTSDAGPFNSGDETPIRTEGSRPVTDLVSAKATKAQGGVAQNGPVAIQLIHRQGVHDSRYTHLVPPHRTVGTPPAQTVLTVTTEYAAPVTSGDEAGAVDNGGAAVTAEATTIPVTSTTIQNLRVNDIITWTAAAGPLLANLGPNERMRVTALLPNLTPPAIEVERSYGTVNAAAIPDDSLLFVIPVLRRIAEDGSKPEAADGDEDSNNYFQLSAIRQGAAAENDFNIALTLVAGTNLSGGDITIKELGTGKAPTSEAGNGIGLTANDINIDVSALNPNLWHRIEIDTARKYVIDMPPMA